MEFINKTGNSIWLEDIEINIPFVGDEVQNIDSYSILKSLSFQSLVVSGYLDIVSINNSRIEKNIKRLYEENIKKKENKQIDKEEERMLSKSDLEVIVKGHFYEAGGYPKVNRNMAFGLSAMGVNVEIQPVSTRNNDLNELEIKQLNILKKKVGKDAIVIDSIIPTFSDISPTRSYRILYTTIEAASVPKQIIDICNYYNEVWVTSDFCKDVLKEYGVTREIFVMPNSINVNLYKQELRPYDFQPSMNSFVFLSIFGWSYRKGYDALLKAYLKEFSDEDDVSLLIMSRYLYSSKRSGIVKDTISKFIKNYGNDNSPHIARCSSVIPEYEMPKVYSSANVIISCSRGEGFNLPLCEGSLCGLPVIATNFSGQTMFLSKENSTLVDVDNITKIIPGTMHVHYWDGQLFPELRSEKFINDLGKSMRYAYEHYDELLNKNELLRNFIINNYSVDKSIGRIKNRLDNIWKDIINKRK